MSGTRRARPSFATVLASSPWILVGAGVLAMVVLLVIALAAVRGREPRRDAAPVPPAATVPLPEVPPSSPAGGPSTGSGPVAPGLSPRRTDQPPSGAASAPPATAATPASRPAAPRPPVVPPAPPGPAAPRSPLTGRYAVRDSFDDAFIGEVLLTNTAPTPRGWSVRLVLPGADLVTAWVEGAPQGSGSMVDGVFTYTSGVDLAGGASVPLRFHLEHTGGATRPTRCTVDGVACEGL